MGFKAVDAAIIARVPSHAAHLVLICLARHYNHKTGKCCPSYERMAEMMNLSKSSVARAIAELVAGGFIAKKKGRRQGSHEGPNSYRLLFYLEGRLDLIAGARRRYDAVHGPTIGPEQGSSPTYANAPVGERGAKRKRSQPPRRRTRLSEEWKPTKAQRAFAIAKGLTEKELALEAERFVNHWLGEGKVKSDWGRVWYNWVGKALEFKERDNERARASSPGARGQHRFELMRSLHHAAAELSAERQQREGRGRPRDPDDES